MQSKNIEIMKKMGKLGETYIKWVEQEQEKTQEEMIIDNVGMINPKRHIY
jgi:hypothetical protein